MSFHAAKNAKGYNDSSMATTQMMNAMSMNMSTMPGQHPAGAAYPTSHPTLTVPAPPKKDGIKKWFAETKTSISGDLVRSPDDDLFAEIENYIDGLEKQMKNVQGQATALVKKGKEIAHGLFEFGLAFNVLGQSEADTLGQALSQMGQAADELSVTSLQHSEQEICKFEEPLRDYIKTIQAVKVALQKRHEKRLTYTTCLSEVATKRTNLAKLRATPGMEAKAYGAEMSLKRGEANAEIAREEFATVSQRVLREVDRFKREKADDMRRMVLDYIVLNIEYNKKMETVWSALLGTLENVKGDVVGVVNEDGNVAAGNGVGGAMSNDVNVSSNPAEQPTTMEGVQVSQPSDPSYSYNGNGALHSVEPGVSHSTSANNVLGGSVVYRDMNEPFAMPTGS